VWCEEGKTGVMHGDAEDIYTPLTKRLIPSHNYAGTQTSKAKPRTNPEGLGMKSIAISLIDSGTMKE
jgi:hypothetical protein